MVVAPDAPGSQFTANLSAGLVAEGTDGFPGVLITGPDHVGPGQSFSLRMNLYSDQSRLGSAERFYGAAIVANFDTRDDASTNFAVLPFSIDRQFGGDALAYPLQLAPQSQEDAFANPRPAPVIALLPGESMRRLFFDLPPSATSYDSLSIQTLVYDDGVVPFIEFSAVRTDFPHASSDALLAQAPADAAVTTTWQGNIQPRQKLLSHPAAGRWYIVATNRGSVPARFSVGNIVDSSNPDNTTKGFGRGANPTIAPGQYFNPQRSGHGISIGRGGDQQMLLWYSYTEDGAPVWYIAQAQAPEADTGWRTAPLYLAAWDGQSYRLAAVVGSVELVPTGTNEFMFTWQLEGRAGSEAFELVAPNDACPTLDGSKTNLSANWYPPVQPGYGIDVLALSDHQAEVFYLYDSQGQARWVYGDASAAAGNASASLDQFSGFCPTCAYPGGIVPTHVGTLNLHFDDWLSGHMQASITLQPPLSGSWNVDQAMARLTGITAPCSH